MKREPLATYEPTGILPSEEYTKWLEVQVENLSKDLDFVQSPEVSFTIREKIKYYNIKIYEIKNSYFNLYTDYYITGNKKAIDTLESKTKAAIEAHVSAIFAQIDEIDKILGEDRGEKRLKNYSLLNEDQKEFFRSLDYSIYGAFSKEYKLGKYAEKEVV